MDEYIASVDGGGTKTLAVVANKQGEVKFLPVEAGCNPFDNKNWQVGLLATLKHLQDLELNIVKINLGLPGYGEFKPYDLAARKLLNQSIFGTKYSLLNDVWLAFYAAFPENNGVLLLAGTGSMSIAKGVNGQMRVGGWGDAFGDEGSAYWIGRMALSLASKALDGRLDAPEFVNSIHQFLGLDLLANNTILLEWIAQQKHQRSAIASLARHVDELAVEGNATARFIIEAAAQELILLAEVAARRAGLKTPICWAHSGSVFNSQLLVDKVSASLNQMPIQGRLSAVGGGLWLAAKNAGWQVDDYWVEKIAKSTR